MVCNGATKYKTPKQGEKGLIYADLLHSPETRVGVVPSEPTVSTLCNPPHHVPEDGGMSSLSSRNRFQQSLEIQTFFHARHCTGSET